MKVNMVMLLWRMKSGLETAQRARILRAVLRESGLGQVRIQLTSSSGSSWLLSSCWSTASGRLVSSFSSTLSRRLSL
jgi:hypothetical protein